MKVKVVHKWNTLLLAPNPFPSMNSTQPIPSHLIFWLYTYELVIACLYYRHHSTPCFSLWFITFLVAFQNSQHTKRDSFFAKKNIKTPAEPCTNLLQLSPSQGALRPLHLCNFGHWRIVVDEWYTALCEVSLKLNLHVQVKEFVHIYRHCNVNLAAAFPAQLSN